MKILFLIFSIFFLFSDAAWYSNWSYRKPITNSVAVGGDLTNFPLLVVISNDSDLQNYASNNGYDIIFTLGVNTNKLAHEIEYYNAGTLTAWVKLPFFSSSVIESNVLYMYFDKNKSGNQQNASAVWDANYKGVWHLSQDPLGAAPQMLDSTTNTNHGTVKSTPVGNPPVQVAGKIGNCLEFSDESEGKSNWVEIPLMNYPQFTVELWGMRNNVDAANADGFFGGRRWNAAVNNREGYEIMIGAGANNTKYYFIAVTTNAVITNDASQTYTVGAEINTWHNPVGVINCSEGKQIMYQDGIQIDSDNLSNAAACKSLTSYTVMLIGRSYQNVGYLSGRVDEVRISDQPRSSNWIVTCYSNMNNPLQYYTLGKAAEYGVPSVQLSAVASPPAVAGQSAVFNISAILVEAGSITNFSVDYGDGSSVEHYAASGLTASRQVSHTYNTGNVFLLAVSAWCDSGKIRTNSMYITPAPFAMPQAGGAELVYLNDGLKIKWTLASTNHISRVVIYRDSMQIASLAPVSSEMEFFDNYLLYNTVYTYQIGLEYNTGMILSTNIYNRPFQPELAQKTIGTKGGTVANLIAEFAIPAGALSADTIISMHIQTNLLYNFRPGYVLPYNQVRIETTPPVQFSSNARFSLRVPFFDHKIRMIPDDGNYQHVFSGNENNLCMSAYSDAGTWEPVYSMVYDKNILPNFCYKILVADLAVPGIFGAGIIINTVDYEKKVLVKNRVFAPQSGYNAMSRVMIFFPNPSYEEVILKIYQMDGKKIYERNTGGSVSMVSWDGLADNGRMSDSGLYIAVITRGGRQDSIIREKIYLMK